MNFVTLTTLDSSVKVSINIDHIVSFMENEKFGGSLIHVTNSSSMLSVKEEPTKIASLLRSMGAFL